MASILVELAQFCSSNAATFSYRVKVEVFTCDITFRAITDTLTKFFVIVPTSWKAYTSVILRDDVVISAGQAIRSQGVALFPFIVLILGDAIALVEGTTVLPDADIAWIVVRWAI